MLCSESRAKQGRGRRRKSGLVWERGEGRVSTEREAREECVSFCVASRERESKRAESADRLERHFGNQLWAMC